MDDSFVIVTDDSCDLSSDYLEERGIGCVELGYMIDGVEYVRSDRPVKQLYDDMRAGKMPSTSQVNQTQFKDVFEKYLKQGKDILYLSFSSGLSGTYNSSLMAIEELAEKYPDRKMYSVDTLCASMGQGLLVHKVYNKVKEGATLEEARDYAKELGPKIIHVVVVDDLMHLQRGGRISKASAIAGSILGIKPIIEVDRQGKLQTVSKVRGRKQALMRIVDNLEELTKGVYNDTFFISHGDCLEDAEFVVEEVKKRFKDVKETRIEYVGPVIGCHTGPGVVAIMMEGTDRGL